MFKELQLKFINLLHTEGKKEDFTNKMTEGNSKLIFDVSREDKLSEQLLLVYSGFVLYDKVLFLKEHYDSFKSCEKEDTPNPMVLITNIFLSLGFISLVEDDEVNKKLEYKINDNYLLLQFKKMEDELLVVETRDDFIYFKEKYINKEEIENTTKELKDYHENLIREAYDK